MKLFPHSTALSICVLFSLLTAHGVGWVSRHDMTSAEFQTEFNTWTAPPYGYRMVSVAGYEKAGAARFAAVWEEKAGPAWITHPQMTAAQFSDLDGTYRNYNLRPTFISGFGVGRTAYCNVIWEHVTGATVVPGVGMSFSLMLDENKRMEKLGYVMVFAWTYNVGADVKYAAIWRNNVADPHEVRHNLTKAQYQSTFDQMSAGGFQLIAVSTALSDGVQRYTGVWKQPRTTTWFSMSDLSEFNYQGETSNWYYQGYRPVFASVFIESGVPKFNAIWHRNGGMSAGNLATINNAMQNYMSTNGIVGLSLAFSQWGRLVYAKGFGQADQGAGHRVNPNHRFRVASVSKILTAAAALKLRDHCGLDLDRPVFGDGALLGESYGTPPYTADERAITTRHLLNHTTGWDVDGIDQVATSGAVVSWMLDNQDPVDPPGNDYQYMNADFCTVGRIIERISGRSYEQFVKDEILAPSCVTDMEIGGDTLAARKPARWFTTVPILTAVTSPAWMPTAGGLRGRVTCCCSYVASMVCPRTWRTSSAATARGR